MKLSRSLLWASAGSIISAVLLASFASAAPPLTQPGAQHPRRGANKLAPGVETKLPLDRAEEETSAKHDVVELTVGVPDLKWLPKEQTPVTGILHYGATGAMFRRGVWHLQFSFKPLRMIRVDVPQANGKMEKKLIWYMVYRITNTGGHMTPVQLPDARDGEYDKWHEGLYKIARVDSHDEMLHNIGPIRFIPTFHLRSHETKKEYLDEIIPVARLPIYRREQPPCAFENFYNTVEISKQAVPVSTDKQDKSVWGVVTWQNLDPRIDYFSIYLEGLTNAYQWEDPPGAYQPGDPPGTGRQFVRKVLKMNFSRKGDEFFQEEEEIRFGIDGQVDYEWVYR